MFLAGESYGTTRASALSGYLIDRGIAFNGIMLISTIMNFETTAFASGNDLPYALFLPSYSATAWYHKKLPPDLQSQPVAKVVADAESFASGEYMMALEKGARRRRIGIADDEGRLSGRQRRLISGTVFAWVLFYILLRMRVCIAPALVE